MDSNTITIPDYGATLSSLTPFPEVNTNLEMSKSIGSIAAALSKAQGEMGAAKKDQSGYGYNYSDLAQVIESSKESLAKNELSVIQLMGKTTDSEVNVITILAHSSGEYFKTESSLPIVEMKSCNKAQEAGATLTYLRRYAYQAIIGQPSEDNDGSSTGFNKSAKPSKAPAKAAKPSSGDSNGTKSGSFRKNKAKPAQESSDDL